MIKLQHLTSSARQLIEERVIEALNRWQAEWCFKQHPLTVAVLTGQQPDKDAYYYSDKADVIAVQAAKINWRDVIFANHATDVPTDAIYDSILTAAKSELYSVAHAAFKCSPQLATLSPTQKAQHLGVIPDSIHQLGTDTVLLEIMIGKQEIRIFFPFSLAGNITAETSIKSRLVSLTPRDIKKSVSMNVSISLGQHLLSDINALEPGDILMSTTPLNSLFAVQLGDKKIADANLGRKGTKKAILLVKPGK